MDYRSFKDQGTKWAVARFEKTLQAESSPADQGCASPAPQEVSRSRPREGCSVARLGRPSGVPGFSSAPLLRPPSRPTRGSWRVALQRKLCCDSEGS